MLRQRHFIDGHRCATGLALHGLPLAWLTATVLGVWTPNMLRKDRSLTRDPKFAAWKERSWIFIQPLS